VCEDRVVRKRLWSIASLCLILAIVRIAGTHAHLAHSHTPGESAAAHFILEMTEEDSPEHLASHEHGDIDADDSAQSTAKLSFLAGAVAPALIFLTLLFLLDPPAQQLWPRDRRPELRPPRRSRLYALNPPSHAPPVAS
jgi:hypothetical protein